MLWPVIPFKYDTIVDVRRGGPVGAGRLELVGHGRHQTGRVGARNLRLSPVDLLYLAGHWICVVIGIAGAVQPLAISAAGSI